MTVLTDEEMAQQVEINRAMAGRGSTTPQVDGQGNSVLTGKPVRNSLDVYMDQLNNPQKPSVLPPAAPGIDTNPKTNPNHNPYNPEPGGEIDWGWSGGAMPNPTGARSGKAAKPSVPGSIADDPVQVAREFASIWTPEQAYFEPRGKAPAPAPKPAPAAAPTAAADPITKTAPAVGLFDPWTGKWTVTGASGLSASSEHSLDAAIHAWNGLVAAYATKP